MILALAPVVWAQDTPEPTTSPSEEASIETVEVVHVETLPWPEDFQGERPFWQTNRFGQVLLVDADDETFVLDQAGRRLRRVDSTEGLSAYTFPMKYLERWSDHWLVVRDGQSRPLAEGPDFTGAALLTRWGDDRHDALLRLERGGIEVWTVRPPAGTRDFPACFASVPESCYAGGMRLLKEHAGDPVATRVARAQIDRACQDGVVRACFTGVALGEDRNAPAASACLDGEAQACATVAGAVYAESKLKGRSSEAGQRMLEYACNQGVAASCSEAAQLFDERNLPHNALLMLDRACVSGDREACDAVESRRDRAFAEGIAKACLKDEPDAVGCLSLAQFLEEKPIDGLGIDAFDAWSRACQAGEDAACRAMGPYVDRWGSDHQRVAEATGNLLASCEAGSQGACVGAAHLLVRLDPSDPAYPRARRLYADACAAGLVEGCLAGAATSWAGPARSLDLPDARALYRTACDADRAEGCSGLGRLLARDRKRTAEAVPVLQRGCELGSPSACTQVGMLVLDGRLQSDLDPRAVFQKACDDGDAEACLQLGHTLVEGTGPGVGTPAYTAYKKGCTGGNPSACEAVGQAHLARQTHYEAGIAAGYLETACTGGAADGCAALGRLYRSGFGVEKDRRHGHDLLVQAGLAQPIRHVRLGARLGFLNLLGLDTEFVLPLPAGPAVSLGGEFSYLPGTDGLSMSYVGPTVRVYPAHAARGLYAAAGWHQFRIVAKDEVTTNAGFNGRVGVRLQKGSTFGGVEIGLASVDAPRVQEIIRPIPLVVPVFGVSGGVAFF